MRLRVLLPIRFWGSLAIGVVAACYAISVGSDCVIGILGGLHKWAGGFAYDGLGDSAKALGAHLGAAALTLLTIVLATALVVAIAFISWRAVYLVLGLGLRTTGLTLPDYGRESRTPGRPYWADGGGNYKGKLDAFKLEAQEARGEYPTEFRIGIILAGGGAKGVYQAGALKALREFLEQNHCTECMRMVAGTSIGSWNAMFWLANAVKEDQQKNWWTSARLATVVTPAAYVPFFRNFIGTNEPWRRDFEELFNGKISAGPPYFYLTRSDINSAELEFTTNRKKRDARAANRDPDYRDLKTADPSWSVRLSDKEVESAVFASMDIPPAFKRMRGEDRGEGGKQEIHQYEDGGVIDNLPIRFATWYEGCNLIFVFPLNASFASESTGFSPFNLVSSRLFRIMDIRQGVLETSALKDISLYNQITRTAPGSLPGVHTKPATVFCICPGPELKVSTFGFSKLRSAGADCFEMMYKATQAQLQAFDFDPARNHEVWMATVESGKDIGYKNFTVGN